MADLWRLVHVNADHTRQLGKYMVEFPEFYPGQPTESGSAARYADSESLQIGILLRYEDVMRYMPKEIPSWRGPGSAYDPFVNAGFGEGLVQGTVFSEVGERLYIDRWDAKHPYIEAVAINSANLTLGYYTASGVQAYQVTITHSSASNAVVTQIIPWVANLRDVENWETKNDCRLITGTLTYYITGGAGFGYSFGFIQQANVSSVANAKAFWGVVEPLDSRNPYSPGGKTMPGGGRRNKQDFGDWSDGVDPDELPTIGATSAGLVTIFSPTTSQVKHLSDVLWGKDFLTFMQNLVENIGEMFISFGMVPFTVPTSGSVDITFFDWVVTLKQQETNIPMRLVSEQFIEMDMGSIDLATDGRIHRTDGVFDYSPYSRLGIYLPFIGFEELDIDEVRESILHLVYRFDLLSGTCVALLSTIVNGVSRTLYQFTGNCLTQIPLTGVDCQTMITNAVNLGIAATSAGATSAVASAGGELSSAMAENPPAKQAEAVTNARNNFSHAQQRAQVSNARGSLASASANVTMGMKPNFKHSGAIGASGSMICVKQPYLFLTTPNEAVPDKYEMYCGLPSNITSRLGDLSGFTVVEDIRLNGLVATSGEVDEIYRLLKEGVII